MNWINVVMKRGYEHGISRREANYWLDDITVNLEHDNFHALSDLLKAVRYKILHPGGQFHKTYCLVCPDGEQEMNPYQKHLFEILREFDCEAYLTDVRNGSMEYYLKNHPGFCINVVVVTSKQFEEIYKYPQNIIDRVAMIKFRKSNSKCKYDYKNKELIAGLVCWLISDDGIVEDPRVSSVLSLNTYRWMPYEKYINDLRSLHNELSDLV